MRNWTRRYLQNKLLSTTQTFTYTLIRLIITLAVAFKEVEPSSRISMIWTDKTLGFYADFNTTGTKFETWIFCALRFKTVWKSMNFCLVSNGYEGFGPADFHIIYDGNIFIGGETMLILLYKKFAFISLISLWFIICWSFTNKVNYLYSKYGVYDSSGNPEASHIIVWRHIKFWIPLSPNTDKE